MTDPGQPTDSQALTDCPPAACTKYARNPRANGLDDPDLAVLVEAWDRLPEAVRARIVGLVEGATASVGEL